MLVERENELKRDSQEIKVEREKLRLASVVRVELEPTPKQLKESIPISQDNEKEVESLHIQLSDLKKEIAHLKQFNIQT